MKKIFSILLVLALSLSAVASEITKENTNDGITATDVLLSPVYLFLGIGFVAETAVAFTVGGVVLAVKKTTETVQNIASENEAE
jgi:hypothetical protein